MTWQPRPATYDEPVDRRRRRWPQRVRRAAGARRRSRGRAGRASPHAAGTARGSACRITFTVLTAVAVVVASLFEIIPTFLIRSNVPTIASVKPYTPLELAGRDIYIREGCYNCHSQMIRPFRHETVRYGEYSQAGRVRLRPPVPVGLAAHRARPRARGRQVPATSGTCATCENPRAIIAAARSCRRTRTCSRDPLDFDGDPDARRRDGDARRALRRRGEATRPEHGARRRPASSAQRIVAQGGPAGLEDTRDHRADRVPAAPRAPTSRTAAAAAPAGADDEPLRHHEPRRAVAATPRSRSCCSCSRSSPS